ncbi:unnamed protein product [Mesocestoides corti]|uniref:HYR domain-containing protein n=1 Tax=Mesocestoides corti TaxID=53468 RepID=A0A0R3URQ4_MESCO|nr:unnamed protein product [Mesocestoides corti]
MRLLVITRVVEESLRRFRLLRIPSIPSAELASLAAAESSLSPKKACIWWSGNISSKFNFFVFAHCSLPKVGTTASSGSLEPAVTVTAADAAGNCEFFATFI